ncbi:MAG: penicillin-binding protein, partial [Bauldia sp.]
MRDPFENSGRRRGPRFIEIDAWVDSSLYRAGKIVAAWAESFSLFMRRFRVTGWKRGIVEVLGDALTLGAGGAVVMLTLALPAFE